MHGLTEKRLQLPWFAGCKLGLRTPEVEICALIPEELAMNNEFCGRHGRAIWGAVHEAQKSAPQLFMETKWEAQGKLCRV